MKKLIFLFPITLFSVLVSCSTDSEIISENLTQNQVCDYISLEELLQENVTKFSNWKSSTPNNFINPITRSSVNIITLMGYTSKDSNKKQKVMLDRKLTTAMGIANQVYIIENVTFYQDIHIEVRDRELNFVALSTPLCGLNPTKKDYTRGYVTSGAEENGDIRLATYCIHVVCDLLGKNYDMWYPCKPEELKWTYKLINL